MPRFVIDEDLSRSTGRILQEYGYVVKDIRDYGLRGAKDEEIYEVETQNFASLQTDKNVCSTEYQE